MLDHVGFNVKDLNKSKKFYETALAPLGVKLLADLAEYNAAGFGTMRPQFWVAISDTPSTGDRKTHICFAAKNRTEVNAFYDAAIKAGGKDNGQPGLRPIYHENYYGAFVFDPDGNNIEACCHLPE